MSISNIVDTEGEPLNSTKFKTYLDRIFVKEKQNSLKSYACEVKVNVTKKFSFFASAFACTEVLHYRIWFAPGSPFTKNQKSSARSLDIDNGN